ncbi:hypothetical protein BJX99DRAFT_267948 [Aspergillus californicus]
MAINCDSSSIIYLLLFLVSDVNPLKGTKLTHVQSSTTSLVLGALAWSTTTSLSLPLPTWIPALSTVLPPLSVLCLGAIRILQTTPNQNRLTHLTQAVPFLKNVHTILLTLLATLALSYLYPSPSLTCNLDNQWQSLFQAKNAPAIRAIQDRFQCCGLRSTHDRAWPFKDRDHRDDACAVQMGYTQSCLQSWSGGQRDVSWKIAAGVLLIFFIRIGFAQLSQRRVSWMSTRFLGGRDTPRIEGPALEEGEEDTQGEGEARRTLLPQSRPGQENVWDVD